MDPLGEPPVVCCRLRLPEGLAFQSTPASNWIETDLRRIRQRLSFDQVLVVYVVGVGPLTALN